MFRSSGAAALAAAAFAFLPAVSLAQSSNPGWFVPKQGQAPSASAPAPARHGRHAAASPVPLSGPAAEQSDASQSAPSTPPVLPLPPVPSVSELPKGAAPPAAVIGVISVPDIMRSSSAAEQVQKVLGARRDKLNQDVQKEQMVWRDMQQSLQDAKNLTNDQARAKARQLQERVLSAQREFKNRQRIIQEAAQVALGQIERELVQVIRQVASSRGMNLVLHQEQIALNIQGFDITQQCADQLNKVLPSVFIPADGIDPEQLAKDGTYPTTAQAAASEAAPPSVQPASTASAPAKGK